MDPFFFGDADQALFGIYQAPAQPVRDAAILLCYPTAHEQIVSHRAFTQISTRLASAGFPVMRFDFYGCGDSAGACEDGTPQRWLRDISAAIGHLRLRSGCRVIGVLGCRFSATLAMIAGAERQDIASLVLWDPIATGTAYIDELATRHQDMLSRTHVAERQRQAPGGSREFLGMAMGDAALCGIAAIDALALGHKPAPRAFVVESEPEDRSARIRRHLAALGTQVEYQHLPVENAWTWIEDVNKVLVPQHIVQRVVSWFSEVHA